MVLHGGGTNEGCVFYMVIFIFKNFVDFCPPLHSLSCFLLAEHSKMPFLCSVSQSCFVDLSRLSASTACSHDAVWLNLSLP